MWRINVIPSQRAKEKPDIDVGKLLHRLIKYSEYVALFSRKKHGTVFENTKNLNPCMTRSIAQFQNTAQFQLSTFQFTTVSVEHPRCLAKQTLRHNAIQKHDRRT